MKRWCARVSIVVLCLLTLAACKKEGELPPGFGPPRGPAVDVTKLQAPALLAHIPADAPYVLASFEAVPLEYLAKVKRMIGPAMARSLDQLRAIAQDGELARWIDAVTAELDGKLNAKGLESLGLSAQPRFAIYGHGALPAVARLEIKDGKALLATIERVAHRAGAKLPALETRHGRELWRIELPSDMGAIVAIADNQLIAAIGPRHTIAAALPQILGAEQPAKNMADGAELKQLIAKHRLGPVMIGFVDSKRLASSLIALAERAPAPACAAEIDRMTAQVPRFVLSYTELTDKRYSFGAVLELAPPLVAVLQELRATVPGLGAALAGEPMFAMGGGIDLARGQTAGKAMAAALGALGEACETEGLIRAGREMREGLSKALPAPLAKIAGVAIAIDSIDLGGGAGGGRPTMPRAIDGVALLAASDAKGVFEAISQQAPPVGQLGPKADGRLHALELKQLGLPFDVHAGVGEQAIVVAAGSRGKQRADKAIDASGGGKAPFFAGTFDVGKLMELQAQLGASATPDIDMSMAKMFGRMTFSIDATDAGLAIWASGDLK